MKQSLILRDAMRMPAAGDSARIGLFGGSFNPPHEGHLNLCDLALKRLELDQIWWLVTPGNPLKDASQLAPLEKRIVQCKKIISHPRIKVTAFEAAHKVRYTADTLRLVKRLRPRNLFVWLMGADNLADFHRWQDWRDIANMMPFAVIDRPGSTMSYHSGQASISLSKYRIDEGDAPLLSRMKPPAWTFLHGPRSSLSSTQLRAEQKV